jgi:GT2 family glycosyltransferase
VQGLLHMFSIVMCTLSNINLIKWQVPIILASELVGEFIIVDNGSKDRTIEYIINITDSRLVVVKNNKNLGVIISRNQGLKLASQKYSMILDDDQIVKIETFERYKRTLCECDIAGFEPQIMDFYTGLTHPGTMKNFTYVGAGGMAMKTELWGKLGYFDEVFSPCYFEDPVICIRAKKMGKTILPVPDNGIKHLGHQTLFRHNLGFNHDNIMIRNRKIFLDRYGRKLK